MTNFSDAAKNVWIISITIGTIKRVKALVGVDLADAFDGKLYPRLAQDITLLSEVTFALIQPQAMQLSITQAQFDAALDGETIAAARKAVLESLADFFQSGHPEVAAMIRKMVSLAQQAGPILIRQLEAIDLESELSKSFGNSSTHSPDNSGSTRVLSI